MKRDSAIELKDCLNMNEDAKLSAADAALLLTEQCENILRLTDDLNDRNFCLDCYPPDYVSTELRKFANAYLSIFNRDLDQIALFHAKSHPQEPWVIYLGQKYRSFTQAAVQKAQYILWEGISSSKPGMSELVFTNTPEGFRELREGADYFGEIWWKDGGPAEFLLRLKSRTREAWSELPSLRIGVRQEWDAHLGTASKPGSKSMAEDRKSAQSIEAPASRSKEGHGPPKLSRTQKRNDKWRKELEGTSETYTVFAKRKKVDRSTVSKAIKESRYRENDSKMSDEP